MANLPLTHLGHGRIFQPRLWSHLSDSGRSARSGDEVSARLLREALLPKGRRAVLTVSSGSMEPTLKAGDRVIVEGAELSSLRCGDIVVYESPVAGLIVHRLVWKVPPMLAPKRVYTKGDALPHLDRPFPSQGILGRVVEIENGRGRRRVRRASTFLKWTLLSARWVLSRGAGGKGRIALTHRGNR